VYIKGWKTFRIEDFSQLSSVGGQEVLLRNACVLPLIPFFQMKMWAY
jgi:hypothetical protein